MDGRKSLFGKQGVEGGLVIPDAAEERDGGPCSCRGRWQVPIQNKTRGWYAQADERMRQGNSKVQTRSLERTSGERRRVLCEYECVLEGKGRGGWSIC